jgi:hypothetical protein
MVTPPLVLYSRLIRGNPISAVLLMIRQHYARAKYDPYSFRQSVVTLLIGLSGALSSFLLDTDSCTR